MEAIVGLLVIALFLKGMLQGGGEEVAARMGRVRDRWADAIAPGAQVTEWGQRGAMVARAARVVLGTTARFLGATAAVGGGILAAALRGGVASVRDGLVRLKAWRDAHGGARPGFKDILGSLFGRPTDPPPAAEPGDPSAPTPPAPAAPAAPDIIDVEFVDVTPEALTATVTTTSVPTTTTDTEETTMSGEVETTGGIKYNQAVAAVNRSISDSAALTAATQITGGNLAHLIACLGQVGMADEAVTAPLLNAMEAIRTAYNEVEKLSGSLNETMNALVARHGDVAAAAAGKTGLADIDFYAQVG